jgi:hypothetical protein
MAAEQVRINTIRHAHEQYTNARNNMVVMAFVIGFEMTAQKDAMPHGRFEEWCEINLPDITTASRTRYMKFSIELQRRHKELGPEARALLLTNTDGGEVVRQEGQTKLGEQIYELTDGASLTQLYKDTGVIKQPKRRTPPARRPAKKLTPDEQLEKRRDAAEENWAACETQLTGCGTSFVLLDDLAVNAQIAFLQRHLEARKRWVGAPAKKRDVRLIEKLLAGKKQ